MTPTLKELILAGFMLFLAGCLTFVIYKSTKTADIDTQNKLGIIQLYSEEKVGEYRYTRISYENNAYLLVRLDESQHFEIIKLDK